MFASPTLGKWPSPRRTFHSRPTLRVTANGAAHLARCCVSRRRSLDRTDNSHSTVAATALPAPKLIFAPTEGSIGGDGLAVIRLSSVVPVSGRKAGEVVPSKSWSDGYLISSVRSRPWSPKLEAARQDKILGNSDGLNFVLRIVPVAGDRDTRSSDASDVRLPQIIDLVRPEIECAAASR